MKDGRSKLLLLLLAVWFIEVTIESKFQELWSRKSNSTDTINDSWEGKEAPSCAIPCWYCLVSNKISQSNHGDDDSDDKLIWWPRTITKKVSLWNWHARHVTNQGVGMLEQPSMTWVIARVVAPFCHVVACISKRITKSSGKTLSVARDLRLC